MSTKIYNGYKITLPIEESLNFLKKVREKLETEKKSLIASRVALQVSRLMDGVEPNDKEIEISDLISKVYDQDRAAAKSTMRELFSYSCSAVLFPFGEHTLVLFYDNSNPSFTKIWQSFEEVNSYWYWDNSDMDEDVSEVEWEARKRDWNSVLPGSAIPIENGLVWEFLSPEINVLNQYSLAPEIFNFMPTWEQRFETAVRSKLKAQALDEYLKKRNLTSLENYKDWTAFEACYRELAIEENFKQVETSVREEMQQNLVPNITKDAVAEYNKKFKTV